MFTAVAVLALACTQDVPPQVIRPGGSFSGRVTAVDKDTVTVQGIEAEFRGVVSYVSGRGTVTFFGNPVTLITLTKTVRGARVIATREGYTVVDLTGSEVVIRECDQIPRKFSLGQVLANGGASKGLAPADSYRVRDVKVGDGIGIRYERVGRKDVCTQIRIFARPGGSVPPSPDDPGDAQGIKFHERQNAENDWADKGIPLPDRFLSPQELAARRARTAPMPREVKPKP